MNYFSHHSVSKSFPIAATLAAFSMLSFGAFAHADDVTRALREIERAGNQVRDSYQSYQSSLSETSKQTIANELAEARAKIEATNRFFVLTQGQPGGLGHVFALDGKHIRLSLEGDTTLVANVTDVRIGRSSRIVFDGAVNQVSAIVLGRRLWIAAINANGKVYTNALEIDGTRSGWVDTGGNVPKFDRVYYQDGCAFLEGYSAGHGRSLTYSTCSGRWE